MLKRKYLIGSLVFVALLMGVVGYFSNSPQSEISFGDAASALSPGTVVSDATVGTVAWSSPDNAKVSDAVYASALLGCAVTVSENSIKIIKGGTISGTNQSTGTALPGTDSYVTYGGSTTLWGTTWSASDINASNFGASFSVKDSTGLATNYLTATNFGFSIPAGATVTGIKVEIQQLVVTAGGVCGGGG